MSWERFKNHYLTIPTLEFSLDISKMIFEDGFFDKMEPKIQEAFAAMRELENGKIANPDEDRMVGHYWLRNPALAPVQDDAGRDLDIQREIRETLDDIKAFAAAVHAGEVKGSSGKFTDMLIVGIGGSALGPQFVSDALTGPKSRRITPHFFDNTDPDGIDRTLAGLEGRLGQTLTIVISKSGGTPETRNGMIEAKAAYKRAGLEFGPHAVAITTGGSNLDKIAESEGWVKRFPMWDWVGGRTSELSAVGLVPAALEGIDIQAMLDGAAAMDQITRSVITQSNPAAILALMWHHATGGKGERDMVIIPYKDRLALFSKYLQQLVMESLGKQKDLDGKTVNQGLAVYGNKGSTDQHSYIQQLREGVNNFFVTFVQVLEDRAGEDIEVDAGATTGDFLKCFLLGTRSALAENGRESITITVRKVDAATVGRLIALYERAVGFYAALVNINAYHQPGVEAGKKAAKTNLDIMRAAHAKLKEKPGEPMTVEELAKSIEGCKTDELFMLLEHMAANPVKGIDKKGDGGFELTTYAYTG